MAGQAPASAAPEQEPGVSDVRIGLIKLGSALAASAEQPALSDDLPLTDTSVRDILSLDTAIGTLVDDALAADGDTTLDTLADAFPDDGPLTVKEVTPPADAPADSREWTMDIALEAERPVALMYQDKRLEFGTAELGGELAATLTSKIRFRYVPGAIDLRTFAIVGSSELTTHVWTRGEDDDSETGQKVDIPQFTVVDGFVQLEARGEATIDTTTELALRDPNGRGLITTEDFEFSSASELFNTTTAPQADDVSMKIDLSSDMDDSATGTVIVGPRAEDADTTYAAVKIDRSDALDDIASLTRLQAITGFTQYTSALQAVEGSVDQQFPLLDLTLTDLYSPGQQLLDLLTEQATATIVCGAADTMPPSGAPRPGQVRYCQAVTSSFEAKADKPITWESPDEGVDIEPGNYAGTIGREPTKNIVVSGGDGFPTLRVGFTSDDNVSRHARTAVTSVQALGRAIGKLGLDGGVDYDPTKQALQIAVRQDKDDPEPLERTASTGGNGNLAPLTGLGGLCQAAVGIEPRICQQTGDAKDGSHPDPQAGQATVTTDGRKFHADFGIGLTEPTTPTEGEPVPAEPTFYLVPGDDGLVYEVESATADLAEDAKMVARVGFLQVDVDVTDYSLDRDGTAASVSVPTSTVTLPSDEKVSDAVTVAGLLSAGSAAGVTPQVERGLSAKATLKVEDSQQSDKDANGNLVRPINAQGTIKADWATLRPDALPSVITEGDYDKLRLLDLVPARRGTMGDETTGTTIHDAGADFFTQFGITAETPDDDRFVTQPLYDLGVTGSSSTICTKLYVVSKTKLRCDAGPLATPGTVAEGHPYVIDGDPDALRNILVEDLAAVVTSFAAPDPSLGADRTFPLVDVLPTEISVARNALGKALSGVQEQIAAEVPNPALSVQSMQAFASTFDKLAGQAVTGQDRETDRKLEFTLTPGNPGKLVLETSMETKGKRQAPLRVATAKSEVRVIGSTGDGKEKVAELPVDVASKARFVIGVDLADASSQVRADTGVTEEITKISGNANDLTALKNTLAGRDTDYGSARVKTGVAADVELGIGVGAVTSPPGSDGTWIDLKELPTQIEQTRSVVGDHQTCGNPSGDASDIAACLELPIAGDPAPDPLMVALKANETSGGAGGSVAAEPIAYRFLAEAMGGLNLTLSDALDGDQTLDEDGAPLSLPLVGTNLDAGADVPTDVNTYVAAARAALTDVEDLEETAKVADLQTDLQTALDAAKSQVAGKNITATTGTIDLACTTTCTDKTVADVQQIKLPVTLSGELPTPQQVPFQVGPAGSTIVSDLTVPTKTTWTLDVTVGIGRGTGPFVELGTATAEKPLLKVEIDSQLPTYDTSKNKCHSWARQTIWHGKVEKKTDREIRNIDVPADASSDAECLDAFVGKFPSVMVDRQKDGGRGTFLDATIKVDVPAPGGGAELVYLPALFDKKVDFVTKATGTGSISTYFESFASQAGFFDIVGTIDLSWNKDGYSSDGLRFGLLQLDVTTVNNAVLPGFDKAKKWLAPLNPVVDQLTRPIPVVTNLSELVGSGPVTLMTLLQKKNTPLNLIVNLLQLQNLIAGGPTTGADLREIGTGTLAGFKVDPAKVGVGGKCTETGTADGKPHTRTNDGKGASGRCRLGNFTKMKQYVTGEKPPKDPKGLKVDKTVTRSPYISLPSVSVPVLQDTSQIFNLIEDSGDATMLYVDLGHAGVSGQIIRKFGPFAVGPIPVTASIGGTVGLDGRFAFGFDTRGLSRKLEALDTGDISGFDDLTIAKPNEPAPAKISVFSDGFYIDDLEKGVDVPEISLTFTVQAGAAISLGVFEAGITGGVTLDLSLDAFDPNADGKIYTDEFAGTSSGPDCAFNVSSGISFFLQFYFSIELIFYTIHKSFDIVRSPRYTLFEFNCEKEEPRLAVLDGEGTANPKLVLTMGPERARRNGYDAPGEHLAEKYTVRQLGPPTKIGDKDMVDLQVSAFSLTENHRVPANTIIKADGDEGSDTVRLYPIPTITTDADNRPEMAGPGDPGYVAPTFTQRAFITGGNGADTIETGDADDDVSGGAGSDAIRTGAGNDQIRGGDDGDQLDAGEGQDTIEGGGGDDRIQGGPGADEVRGESGDDILDGGVGSSPDMLFPTTSANRIRPLLDAGDLVVGGDGADTVDGGNGSDVVVGGSYAARPDYVDTQSNTVYGVDEANRIQRVDVTGIKTLKLPSAEAVRLECASPGASGELGPDVVTGGGERDLVIGGAGSDTLSGGGADDVVCGRAGDDLLDGDGQDVDEDLQGDDVVRGGPGMDRMYGSAGQDDMYGDLGDDLVRGGQDDDTISGGAGSDLLLGEGGIDEVEGDAPAEDSQVTTDPADDDRSGRAITCSTSTSVVGGGIDLDGDLAGNDDGRLEGMTVDGGRVEDADGNSYNGIVSGVVFVDGQADLDGNGVIEARTRDALGDTGSIPLGGITGAAGNGDCILGGDEVDDRLDGGVGADYVDAGAGDDTDVRGGPGNDLVRGGDGRDVVHGDSGDDLVAGDAGGDILFGNAGDDVVRGGSGDDLVAGGSSTVGADDGADEVLGDGGDDAVLGGNGKLSRTALADTAIAGVGVTLLDTEADDDVVDDLVYGGTGNDWVFAQSGDDEAYGGPGQDVVEGGPGKDRVQGDDGEDLVVGGSSTTGAVTKDRSAAGTADSDDFVVGDGGVDDDDRSDVLVGDNARLQIDDDNDRPSWARVRDNVSITLFDVPSDVGPAATPDPDASGDDTMRGGGFDDLIFGQSGDDTIEGGAGADGIEGGAGQDTVHGDGGDDEILGGSWTAATHDGDDALHGDDGTDVLIGDNGNPANGFSPYVTLHDVPAAGATTPAAWFGGDDLSGGDDDDQLFGQSGEDTIAGGAGIDLLEGGADHDTMSGGTDDDTLTGGSSSSDGVISPDRTGAGQLDADDEMSGGPGDDVLAGDNARLVRTDRQRTDGTRLRSVRLFDLSSVATTAPTGTGDGDTLEGDEGRDLVFGQAGDDTIGGGTGADYLEGNDGADTLMGGTGEDDLVGGGSTKNGAIITISGSSVTDRLLTAPGKTVDDSAAGLLDGNDVLDGGDSRDVLLGDNGRVTRNGPNKTLAGGASGMHVVRQVAMADKVPGVWSGSDRLTGGAGDDDLYGQFDNSRTKRPQLKHLSAPVPGDILSGGTGDDALVGDQGVVVPTPAAALGAVNRVVKDKKSFFREVVRPRGTLVKVVTLTHSTVGGDDLVLGNDGKDSVHAGAGTDVVNAGAQDDVVFGGDGNDALWGGAHHDLVFGGAGNDLLDIKRRTKDSKLWQVSAPAEDTDRRRRTLNGRDVLYGGSGRDALQADQGDLGSGSRVQGDRLIDWRSTTNFFKTCQSGYGPGKISNVASSSMTSALRSLAAANGAVGSAELAIASSKERVTKYPDTRTFICESS